MRRNLPAYHRSSCCSSRLGRQHDVTSGESSIEATSVLSLSIRSGGQGCLVLEYEHGAGTGISCEIVAAKPAVREL